MWGKNNFSWSTSPQDKITNSKLLIDLRSRQEVADALYDLVDSDVGELNVNKYTFLYPNKDQADQNYSDFTLKSYKQWEESKTPASVKSFKDLAEKIRIKNDDNKGEKANNKDHQDLGRIKSPKSPKSQ